MILYGMQLLGDIELPLTLPLEGEYKDTITLSSDVPQSLKDGLCCGTYLHTTHEHKIYLYSNRDISEPMVANQPLCYEADGSVRFYWYHKSKTIYYEILETTMEEFGFWFVHPYFSLFLTIEEYFVLLHGSAIEIDGKSILFLAPYKSGKSTLTHYLSQQGHKLIADDILPTFIQNDKVYYAPSHPYSRPFRGVQALGVLMKNYKTTFGTIDTIYILRNNNADSSVSITPVKGVEKFQLVRKNSLIYTLPYIRIRHEKYLGVMLNSINCFVMDRPWGKEHLKEIYNAIKKHNA